MRYRVLIALLLTAAMSGAQERPPLSKTEVQELLAGGVSSARAAKLVEQYGIDFAPTEIYLDTLRSQGATEVLLKALPAAAVKGHLARGAAFLEKDANPQAEQEYRAALQADASSVAAHCGLGEALYEQEKLDPALAEYREALRLQPDSAAAHRGVGRALFKKKDTKGALAEIRESLRLKPDYAEAHGSLGAFLMSKGDVDAGIVESPRSAALEARLRPGPQQLGHRSA